MYRRTRPVSRQQLEQVFSLNDEVSPESIELYIHRLRKNLREACFIHDARPGVMCWSAAMKWGCCNRCTRNFAVPRCR